MNGPDMWWGDTHLTPEPVEVDVSSWGDPGPRPDSGHPLFKDRDDYLRAMQDQIDRDIREMVGLMDIPVWLYNQRGPVESEATSDPDGTVVHIITTL